MSDKLALRRIIEIATAALAAEAEEPEEGEEMEPEEQVVADTARGIREMRKG
jgi:DNA-binding FadR family transcriptional regulator